MNRNNHNFEVNLPVAFIKDGKQVIAYTPALDISTAGKDENEAKKRFVEMVHIFIADLMENGTTEEVLSDLGWQKGQFNWNPPKVEQQSISVSAPQLV